HSTALITRYSPFSPSLVCYCTRRHPTSPPFPYTTLFRSRTSSTTSSSRASSQRSAGGRFSNGVAAASEGGFQSSEAAATPFEKRDRKSTRLNSSHVASSYAAFCLKEQIT